MAAPRQVRIEMSFLDRRIVGGGSPPGPRRVWWAGITSAPSGRPDARRRSCASALRALASVRDLDGLARVDRETSAIALARAGRGERAWALPFLFRPPYVLARELFARGGSRTACPASCWPPWWLRAS